MPSARCELSNGPPPPQPAAFFTRNFPNPQSTLEGAPPTTCTLSAGLAEGEGGRQRGAYPQEGPHSDRLGTRQSQGSQPLTAVRRAGYRTAACRRETDWSAVLWTSGKLLQESLRPLKHPFSRLSSVFFSTSTVTVGPHKGWIPTFPADRPAGNRERCVLTGSAAMPLGRGTRLPLEDDTCSAAGEGGLRRRQSPSAGSGEISMKLVSGGQRELWGAWRL